MATTVAMLDGRYDLISSLGAGNQARVWRVRDRQTGDTCVLKAMERAWEHSLVDELEALRGLRHPALARPRDVARARDGDLLPVGTAYFTADDHHGRSSLEALAAAPAAARPGLLASIAIDVAGALAAIHAHGLLHHDVSPGNILVVDGDGAMLLDLGLAAPRQWGDARGTPAYMAPEALAGRADVRSDLYSLGAALHHLASGSPFFLRGGLGDTARAVVRETAPALDLPPALADLIARLLSKDPARRPASALVVFDELDQLRAVLRDLRARPRPTARVVSGHAHWVSTAPEVAAMARLLEEAPRGARLCIWGPAGNGGLEVALEAVGRAQVAMIERGRPTRPLTRGSLELVASALAVADHAGSFAAEVVRCAAQHEGITLLDLGEDPRARAALRALSQVDGPGTVIAVVTSTSTPAHGERVGLVEVGAVSPDRMAQLAAMLFGRPVPSRWTEELHRASRGLLAVATEICRCALLEADPLARSPQELVIDGPDGIATTRARLAELGGAARALVDALVVWDGVAPVDAAIATAGATGEIDAEAMTELVATGLVRRVDASVCASGNAVRVASRDLPRGRRVAMHRAAATWASAHQQGPTVRAPHLIGGELIDEEPDAITAVLAAADSGLSRGRADHARDLMRDVLAAPGRSDRAPALERLARAELVLGDYGAAAAAAAELVAVAPERARQATLLLSRARQRSGDLAAAEAALRALPASDADDEVQGALARVLVALGRYDEAWTLAGAVPAKVTADNRARIEARGLAAFYRGDAAAADAAFALLEQAATIESNPEALGRALSLRGLVAQRRGDLVAASAAFARAAVESRRAGDGHAAAVADLNAATALAERGRHGEALARLAAARADLDDHGVAAGGDVAELAAVELNRGTSLLQLGQLASAADAAAAALAAARRQQLAQLEVFALLLAGDVASRSGDLATARLRYRDADDAVARSSDPTARFFSFLAQIEADAASGGRWLGPAADAATTGDDRDRLEVARGRVALATAGRDAAVDVESLLDVARRARSADRAERAFRALAVAAQLAATTDPARARTVAREAGLLHAQLGATAGTFAAGWNLDGDLAALTGLLSRPDAVSAVGDGVVAELRQLRRLLGLSRRLFAEGSVPRLVDDIIDAAIELTSAERGFLLLAQGQTLEVAVARGFATGDLGNNASISRSIAAKAVETGEPVITFDAGADQRFGGSSSISALRLRSVMAVPLAAQGNVVGCLYVDHRLKDGAFDDDAAALLVSLADLAATAVARTRDAEALRRDRDGFDEANRRLAADVAERDAELVAMRARLATGGRDTLRHRYPAIVGESQALVGLLARLDRAAEVTLPVVLVGESGTGKELVARALHDNGPRRDRAFVAINCSAVPEQLLESELFGHVRGAFTGADRDRKGLFEIAHGGTLLLDEIADTGPAMQAKLLRALQDGSIRRVGDERALNVDVRVVATTQRPLAELVAAGRFREDLRFRLDVLALEVPALRDRDGDLPLLVAALLDKMSPGPSQPRFTRAALRALTSYSWPGNVRELENAIARAVALGGEVIDVDDLPESVVAGASRRLVPAGNADLTLRPALEALEGAYIAAAMTRAGGNQTAAAKLLGLSRFGLQKKLRRRSEGE